MDLAHGIGGAKDLPIPLEYAVAGAGLALAVSFVVLAFAWRTPRFDARRDGRPVPGPFAVALESRLFSGAMRGLGLVLFGYTALAALAGPDELVNPTFGIVYVWLWVGLVPASLLLGPVYRAISPVRTLTLLLTRAMGGAAGEGLFPLPVRVGYWPAAVGLFAFVWLELVSPDSTYLPSLRLWFALYLAIMLMGGVLFGDRWLSAADPFEVYSSLVARLCPVGRREDGTLVVRSPLANLDGVRAEPGLVGVVGVLFGSTAFDSFQDSSTWLQVVQTGDVYEPLLNTAALVGFCVVVVVSFSAATMATATHEGTGLGGARGRLPAQYAHSMVPIVVGYVFAHYLSYLVETGQQTLIQASDPLGTGADYLGTGGWEVDYWLSTHPTFLAVTKVAAVVTGHVLGVVAAHDRALKVLPARHRLSGQVTLLLVMVLYTVTGLYLLFGA